MKEYDVVIIGGGPAGLTTLRYLSSSYHSLLIEKENKNYIKPCGGLFAEETISFLNDKEIAIPDKIFSKPSKPSQIYLDINNEEKIESSKLLNINRKQFKSWLINKVTKNKIKYKTKLIGIESINKFSILKLKNNGNIYKIKTKFLIDASGAYSKIKKHFNETKRYYTGIQIKLKMNYNLKKVYFIYNNKITDYYIWLIPKINHTILGFGLKNNNFKKKYKKLKDIIEKHFGNFKKMGVTAHKITCPGENDIFLGKKNIFTIGEAAGLISPSSGEGISYAFKSGYYCAKSLNENKNEALDKYKKYIKEEKESINKKIRKRKILKNVFKRKKYFEKKLR